MAILSKHLRVRGGCGLRRAAHILTAALVTATFAGPMLATLWVGPAAFASDLGPRSSVSTRDQGAQPHSDASPSEWISASPGKPVKYYIVPPARNGHIGFLFEIAATTLGNGDLDGQIFSLNDGRLEPGGARFVNPTVIKPGWILELPANASGPDVHFGPLPAVTPAGGASRVQGGSHRHSGAAIVIGAILIILIAIAGLATGLARRHRARDDDLRISANGAAGMAPEPHYRSWLTAIRRKPAAGSESVLTLADVPDAPSESATTPQPALPQALAQTPPGPADLASAQDEGDPESQHGFASLADPPATTGPGDLRWPDYPTPPGDPSPDPDVADSASIAEMSSGLPDTKPSARSEPTGPPASSSAPTGQDGPSAPTGPQDRRPGSAATPEFSPVALRLLGAQRSSAQRRKAAEVPTQSHEVAFGDDRIQVVLTEAPIGGREGKARAGHSWLATTPYLVWAPLPYDAPDDGVAFACVGAWEEGCLFIDLGAAPGAVVIGGDDAAASRLAESLAHQLCTGPAASRTRIVVAGDVLPTPNPPGANWIASLDDLGSLPPLGPDKQTELVFCRLRSNEDAFPLARYVASARRRVIAVALANLPDAPWSFTVQPSQRAAGVLQPVIA
jgi:hypothetical protein